ncbi:MAG: hypothetical protein ACLGG7_04495 [Bacteriovoracia bacterium]
MWKKLGFRFWLTTIAFGVVAVSVARGPELFRRPADQLLLTDTVSTGQAQTMRSAPAPGLDLEVSEKLDAYFLDMGAAHDKANDWVALHREWLDYARDWFERVYPGEDRFQRYADLWVSKRLKIKLWRVKCRQEFFPDLDDSELIQKADWLKDQEEWTEMESKINRGLTTIEAEYALAVQELLGSRLREFKKFHDLYVDDFMSQKRQISNFFL